MRVISGLFFIALVFTSTDLYADWVFTIEVVSGKHLSKVNIGAEKGASPGYDEGRDIPLEEKGLLNAYFSHPDWVVNMPGVSSTDFYQDLRDESYPAVWELKVDSAIAESHKISWKLPVEIPKGLKLTLAEKVGMPINMKESSSYPFNAAASNIFTIKAEFEEHTLPSPPLIRDVTPRNKVLHLSWEPSEEAAGYKVHLGTEPTVYVRTEDIGNVTKLKIKKLENGKAYYAALTAYNKQGVESGYSEEVSGIPFNSAPTSPVIDLQYVEEGKDLILKLSGARDADGELLRYEVEVYSDSKMSQLAASGSADDEGEVNLGKLKNGTYYWRARATDGMDYGSWSGARVIRVDTGDEGAKERFDKTYGRKRF